MYSIKKVSELLDIPAVTIRAWENRYNIIAPARSQGGHRLYSEADMETLQWLKQQTQEKGMKIGDAVRLLKSKPHRSPVQQSHIDTASDEFDELVEWYDRLYRHLLNFNTVEAHAVIDMAFSMYGIDQVIQRFFVPILYKIGDDWENGAVSTAQEHFASGLVLQRCTQLFRMLPTRDELPKALAFCPEHEHHQIGLMLFSLFLRKKGHEVVYLGANSPLNGLAELIAEKNIAIVAISLTMPETLTEVIQWIEVCASNHPERMFVLGGSATQHKTCLNPRVHNLHGVNWESWYQAHFGK